MTSETAELPRGLDDLSAMLGQQHDIRFNCRTSFHIPATADLNLVCRECATKWWAITAALGALVDEVMRSDGASQ